jgi:hypothetical protein
MILRPPVAHLSNFIGELNALVRKTKQGVGPVSIVTGTATGRKIQTSSLYFMCPVQLLDKLESSIKSLQRHHGNSCILSPSWLVIKGATFAAEKSGV